MSSNVLLRLAQCSDISRLAEVANAANSQSKLHRILAPGQDRYPLSYHNWRLSIIRLRFADPILRTIVAQDSSSGELLGFASWAVEGPDTALYKRWAGESTWAGWLEAKFIEVEKLWCQYVTDKSVDYNIVNRFVATSMGTDKSVRPPCLHCHQIVVDPTAQSRGVGRKLIDWAKDLAIENGLVVYLESNLEATRFYEKGGFSRLGEDLVLEVDEKEPIRIPVFAWEGAEREGRWLEREGESDGREARWRWRDDVLPKR